MAHLNHDLEIPEIALQDGPLSDDVAVVHLAQRLAQAWWTPSVARLRFVDVVDDWAGQEICVVDGDALTAFVMHTAKKASPDFENTAIPPLLVVFLFEKILSELESVRCNFLVAWFDSHESLHQDAACNALDAACRRFIRAQLVAHSPRCARVKHFPSIESDEWRAFIECDRPFYVLTWDGLSAVEHPGDKTGPARLLSGRLIAAIFAHIMGTTLTQKDGDCHTEGKGRLSVALLRDGMFANGLRCFICMAGPQILMACHKLVQPYARLAERIQKEKAGGHDHFQLEHGPQAEEIESLLDADSLEFAEQLALAAAVQSQEQRPRHCHALLAMAVLLPCLRLEQRAFQLDSTNTDKATRDFLGSVYRMGTSVVYHVAKKENGATVKQQLINSVDPRLLAFIYCRLERVVEALPDPLFGRVQLLCDIADIPAPTRPKKSDEPYKPPPELPPQLSVSKARLLPYINKNMPDLPNLATSGAPVNEPSAPDDSFSGPIDDVQAELRLWHAATPLASYTGTGSREQKDKPTLRTQGAVRRAEQRQAYSISKLAQSLQGSLNLQRIVVASQPSPTEASKGQHHGSGKSKAKAKAAPSKKEQIIAANIAAKEDKRKASSHQRWRFILDELKVAPPRIKFSSNTVEEQDVERYRSQVKQLGVRLSSKALDTGTQLEMRILRMRLSVEGWASALTAGEDKDSDGAVFFAVEAFIDCAQVLSQLEGEVPEQEDDHDAALLCAAGQVLRVLGLQSLFKTKHSRLAALWPRVKGGRTDRSPFASLPFDFALPTPTAKLAVDSPVEFQLRHCGDYMERQLDSKPDSRVRGFEPDGWQREVLDTIDRDQSVLVVAPTSAGKTFVSMYAIERALRENEKSVVVYVAPTKALVNQFAADIEARFARTFKDPTRSVWAVHTLDYGIHNPLNCSVLVTGPEFLSLCAFDPIVVGRWLPNVKCIIFDEVHALRQGDWEQLLILLPKQIIALSATVGNIDEFGSWLKMVQRSHGRQLKVIQHRYRYNDLKKVMYLPEGPFEPFKGKSVIPQGFGNVLRPLHPFSALRYHHQSIDDLDISSREQLQLAHAMQEARDGDKGYDFDDSLQPGNFFPTDRPIKRADTLRYQAALTAAIEQWRAQTDALEEGSPLMRLMDTLDDGLTERAKVVNEEMGLQLQPGRLEAALPLLWHMHSLSLLPALCFNFTRSRVESLCEHVASELAKAEEQFKREDRAWQAKVREHEQWLEEAPARAKAKEKALRNIKGREEKLLAQQAGGLAADGGAGSWHETFNPEDPLEDFCFVDRIRAGTEFKDVKAELEHVWVPQWAKDAFLRGVAFHHASAPLAWRGLVERYFRLGWLRVVFCTATLSLGVNMPARSTVFVGDHAMLTALEFRQASGRAGRRGLDLAGNVVFLGFSMSRVHRLLTARLPSLTKTISVPPTLILRLHLLLADEASRTGGGQTMCDDFFKLGINEEYKVLNAHLMRCGIEFLRRFGLLDASGKPTAAAGFAAHLHTGEPGNFAFLALLRSGSLLKICSDVEERPADAARRLMLVLCHLFCRRPLSDLAVVHGQPTPRSYVVLPRLPPVIEEALLVYEDTARKSFCEYALVYCETAEAALDEDMPCSGNLGLRHGEAVAAALNGVLSPHLIDAEVRCSAYVCAGNSDDFGSIQDLAETSRQSLLAPNAQESFVFQALDSFTSGRGLNDRLNAYLLDFYTHGTEELLVRDNGLMPGGVWYALDEYARILVALRSGLEVLLRRHARTKQKERQSEAQPDSAVAADFGWTSFELDPDLEADERSSQGTTSTPASSAASSTDNIKTRSGRRLPKLPPLIVIAPQDRDPNVWPVYRALVVLQDHYYRSFAKIFG